jgi:hypothetical protein
MVGSGFLPRGVAPRGLLQGRRVLELGCGHGIPAILCLLAGATAHFQVRAGRGWARRVQWRWPGVLG